MKKWFGVALLALPLLASSVRAGDCCLPFNFKFGVGAHLSICPNHCGCPQQCGPWYLYWPLEAHFQVPAMPQYPYWPSPMGLAPGVAIPGPATAGPAMGCCPPQGGPPIAYAPPAATQPANFHAPAVQAVGYYQQVPSYWYGR
jgi:hypothetical protein